MLFGRAFLFAWLANNAEGGENDKFPFEIQMMAFFTPVRRNLPPIQIPSLFFPQSLRHN